MRLIIVLGLLFIAAWIVYAIRLNSTGVMIEVCKAFCDRQGRHCASVTPGIIVDYTCGDRKRVKGLGQP